MDVQVGEKFAEIYKVDRDELIDTARDGMISTLGSKLANKIELELDTDDFGIYFTLYDDLTKQERTLLEKKNLNDSGPLTDYIFTEVIGVDGSQHFVESDSYHLYLRKTIGGC